MNGHILKLQSRACVRLVYNGKISDHNNFDNEISVQTSSAQTI